MKVSSYADLSPLARRCRYLTRALGALERLRAYGIEEVSDECTRLQAHIHSRILSLQGIETTTETKDKV